MYYALCIMNVDYKPYTVYDISHSVYYIQCVVDYIGEIIYHILHIVK